MEYNRVYKAWLEKCEVEQQAINKEIQDRLEKQGKGIHADTLFIATMFLIPLAQVFVMAVNSGFVPF